MEFRKSTLADIDQMERIAEEGKARLKSKGINQWQRGTYPSRDLFVQDVHDGIGYVVAEGDEVLAICAVTFTDEACYRGLTDGSWKTADDDKYATIHRGAVARAHQGKNISGYLFAQIARMAGENGALSVRADTHPENLTMQRTLERAGFVCCGNLILTDGDEAGDPRLGYELVLKPEVKAVFLDYTGTMVREDEPYTLKLLQRFVMNSDLKDPAKAFATVWGLIKQIESEHYLDTFVKKDEMVDLILNYSAQNYGLKDDLDELHEIWRKSWIYAPLFDDVRPFLERMSVPVYVVTNDDVVYVEESMRDKGLSPAGIISAETVRACKPHREILEEGLRVAGVLPQEAVLIGDSESSDVACAQAVGVTPVLLDRKGKSSRTDIRVIRSLDEYRL